MHLKDGLQGALPRNVHGHTGLQTLQKSILHTEYQIMRHAVQLRYAERLCIERPLVLMVQNRPHLHAKHKSKAVTQTFFARLGREGRFT